MDSTIFNIIVYVFVLLFGVCIGSFLNVCIYRLPLNESLTKRNSHCMTCGEYIKRKDLIPIISWCRLRGKCRACGAKISPRYTIVEALTGVLFLSVFFRFKAIEHLTYMDGFARLILCISTCLAFAGLVVVFFMDWDTQLINIYVVLFIALTAIPKIIFCADITGLTIKSYIIGTFIVSVPFLLIALISHEKALGMGDVYLMAAGGLFLGMQGVLVAALIGLITASVVGMILKHKSGESKFAFGPYLALGIAVASLFGDTIGEWYMNFTHLNETLEQAKILF